jgi:uncharacterized protein YjbI with pentapeptide repeats
LNGAAVANEEHVKRLKQGVAEWNAWREETNWADIDLSGALLSGAILRRADLSNANLSNTDLSHAILSDANLSYTFREGTPKGQAGASFDHTGANLSFADLSRANMFAAPLKHANMHHANMQSANLNSARLDFADLSYAVLQDANLFRANLMRARLNRAILGFANLSEAKLNAADLNGASMLCVNLSKAELDFADLTDTILFSTVFGNVDLTHVVGLEKCKHMRESIIDHLTLQKSGRLPLPFLRGVGLSDQFIDYLPSLLNQAIQYYSCFISYSSRDQEFAERIHADLQNNGVRCWFAPHDLSIGTKILDGLDAAIRVHDKVLLILSEHSIGSDWVEDEVKTAFEEERKREQTVLFPIRLDDAVIETKEAWAGLLRRDRNIGDFRNWKDHDGYKRTFERVLCDLKRAAEQSPYHKKL